MKLVEGVCSQKHPLYTTWNGIKSRCYNEKDKGYKRYGGRGIKLSDEWHDFTRFVKDMGPKPSAKHSIDRIDNDKGYSKDNCRWATPKQQSRNMRSNVRVSFRGQTKTLSEWVEAFEMDFQTLHHRLVVLNLPPESAFTHRRMRKGKMPEVITFRGVTGTVKQIAEELNLRTSAIYTALSKERASSKPAPVQFK